jgi:hypothetical protein
MVSADDFSASLSCKKINNIASEYNRAVCLRSKRSEVRILSGVPDFHRPKGGKHKTYKTQLSSPPPSRHWQKLARFGGFWRIVGPKLGPGPRPRGAFSILKFDQYLGECWNRWPRARKPLNCPIHVLLARMHILVEHAEIGVAEDLRKDREQFAGESEPSGKGVAHVV